MSLLPVRTASDEGTLGDFEDVIDISQKKMPKTTFQKIEDDATSILEPIIDAERTIYEGAKDFVFSIEGLVSICILCVIIIIFCGIYNYLNQCTHNRAIRARIARRDQEESEL